MYWIIDCKHAKGNFCTLEERKWKFLWFIPCKSMCVQVDSPFKRCEHWENRFPPPPRIYRQPQKINEEVQLKTQSLPKIKLKRSITILNSED